MTEQKRLEDAEAPTSLHDIYEHLCDINSTGVPKLASLLECLPKNVLLFCVPLNKHYNRQEFQHNGFTALSELDSVKARALEEDTTSFAKDWKVLTAHVTRLDNEFGFNHGRSRHKEFEPERVERVCSYLDKGRSSNGDEVDDADDLSMELYSIDKGGIVLLPMEEMSQWWGEGDEGSAETEDSGYTCNQEVSREINYWTSTLVVMRSVEDSGNNLAPPKKKIRICPSDIIIPKIIQV